MIIPKAKLVKAMLEGESTIDIDSRKLYDPAYYSSITRHLINSEFITHTTSNVYSVLRTFVIEFTDRNNKLTYDMRANMPAMPMYYALRNHFMIEHSRKIKGKNAAAFYLTADATTKQAYKTWVDPNSAGIMFAPYVD